VERCVVPTDAAHRSPWHCDPQRGFSAGQTGKGDHQIVVFRRGQEPFKTNTKNSFAERDFYGPPDDAVVDDLITSEEGRLGAFVSDARASKST
jgi:hypothetical protein